MQLVPVHFPSIVPCASGEKVPVFVVLKCTACCHLHLCCRYVAGMEAAIFHGYRSFVDTSYDTLFTSLLNWFKAAADAAEAKEKEKEKCAADRQL